MKKLIEQIAEASGLQTLKLFDHKLNPTLLYFEDRDDFYILICSTYDNILQQIGVQDDIKILDYAINAYLDTIKGYDQIKAFGNIIDFNLSSIVVVELVTLDDEGVLKNIHKIEENYKIAKKYILPYLGSDYEILASEIDGTADEKLPEKINDLALKNSSFINNKEESWYQLIMNLFIKLPFLNYKSGSFGLTTVSQLFADGLSDYEKSLLKIINDNYEVNMDVETFISQFKIDSDEQI